MSNDTMWWQTPPATAADDLAEPAAEPVPARPPGMSTRAKAGVLATAVVVGAIGVMTIQGSGSASTTAGTGPGGLGAPPGAQQGGRGGGFGTQGTVSAISASSITVGGTTLSVSSATQVLVNGQQGSLSDVTTGATVFVHNEGTFAERIFVGTMPQGGPGFGPPPGTAGTGTTSTT